MKRLIRASKIAKAIKVDFHDGHDPEEVNESVFKLLDTGLIDYDDVDDTDDFAWDDLADIMGDVCEVKVYPNGDVKQEPKIVHTYPGYISHIVNGDYSVIEDEEMDE